MSDQPVNKESCGPADIPAGTGGNVADVVPKALVLLCPLAMTAMGRGKETQTGKQSRFYRLVELPIFSDFEGEVADYSYAGGKEAETPAESNEDKQKANGRGTGWPDKADARQPD